jgi:hypothetical protein
MRFATFYFSALFLLFFGAAQYADHQGAKQCQERSGLTYNQCRQIKP